MDEMSLEGFCSGGCFFQFLGACLESRELTLVVAAFGAFQRSSYSLNLVIKLILFAHKMIIK